MLIGSIQDFLGWNHDAQINNAVIIALQDHTDDVLPNVVNVALDCCHDDDTLIRGLAGLSLTCFDEGHQVSHRLFHDARRLHHLG